MFTIVTSKDSSELICYGPFNTPEAAEKYARVHKLWGACLIVRLHDCGSTLDY